MKEFVIVRSHLFIDEGIGWFNYHRSLLRGNLTWGEHVCRFFSDLGRVYPHYIFHKTKNMIPISLLDETANPSTVESMGIFHLISRK